jgi:ligand-binding SRPBCC domain-containing protein
MNAEMPATADSYRNRPVHSVEQSSLVPRPAGEVWARAVSEEGINDDLFLAELEPGRRFLERSRTLTFAVWQHERVVEPEGDGACRVTDRLGFELKRGVAWIPGMARLATAVVRFLFGHRHRRLARATASR